MNVKVLVLYIDLLLDSIVATYAPIWLGKMLQLLSLSSVSLKQCIILSGFFVEPGAIKLPLVLVSSKLNITHSKVSALLGKKSKAREFLRCLGDIAVVS